MNSIIGSFGNSGGREQVVNRITNPVAHNVNRKIDFGFIALMFLTNTVQ